eukprot:6054981-Pyramimonas_sp.AAC.1
MERYKAPDDFGKGQFGEALRYMERVKKIVDQLCNKLHAKTGPGEAPKKPAEKPAEPESNSRPSSTQLAPSKSDTISGGVVQISDSMKKDVAAPTADMVALRKELAALKEK